MVRIACASAALFPLLGTATARAQDPTTGARTTAAAGDTLTLTLAGAQRLALRQNPELLAERQEVPIARGQLRQARLPLFNPEAELRLPSAATGGASQYEATVSQELELGGQRGLRGRAAQFGLTRAEAAVRNAGRLAAAEAGTAYYETYAARQRLRLASDALSLNQRLLAAVRIQAREGEISALEANLAEIEFGRARARVLAARREATNAEIELRRVTGLAPDRPLRLSGELPGAPNPATIQAESLVELALSRRPDLAARSAAQAEAQALGRLAQREARPNLRVGAIAEREAEGGTRIGVGVGVPLPIGNRNQGRIAEQQARAQQAALEARAVESRIRTQVTSAVRSYTAASEEVAVFEESVLQPARENRALLETAYRAGKIDLPTLLLLRNQLLDAETGFWDTWLAQRRALVDLESATAGLPTDTDDTNAPRTR